MSALVDSGPARVVETVWRPPFDVSVRHVLGPLRRGAGDPCHQWTPGGDLWRTGRMPTGPVTAWISQRSRREIHTRSWGPGADEWTAGLPELLGARDDPDQLRTDHPLLTESRRLNPGLRLPRTHRVLEALVPAVLEQKVTGQQAFAAWRHLVRRFGEPAPGAAPQRMAVPPDAQGWARIPSWEWHRAGVEPARSATIVRAMSVIGRLEECVRLDPVAAAARLQAVPGIGVWTAAEVAQRAWGDPDAVSVGDYHLSGFVGWTLLGRKVDDATMLELLEPWRGQRHRVVRLLYLHPGAPPPPRRGPRITIQDHRGH